MMDESAMAELVREIRGQGYDRETAGRFAVLIGDLPVMANGEVLVLDDGGKVVGRLEALSFFNRE